jgi:hypothetical protein
MSSTSDFAVTIHEQRQRREQARIEKMRKQDVDVFDDARKALIVERIQKPEPLA